MRARARTITSMAPRLDCEPIRPEAGRPRPRCGGQGADAGSRDGRHPGEAGWAALSFWPIMYVLMDVNLPRVDPGESKEVGIPLSNS